MMSLKYKYIFLITFVLFISCKNNDESIEQPYLSNSGKFYLTGSNHISPIIKDNTVCFETEIIPNEVQPITLTWGILKCDFPITSEYSFCDNTGCYFDLPKENKLNPISKTTEKDERVLKLQVSTTNEKERGSLVILIQTNDSNVKDTLFFEF